MQATVEILEALRKSNAIEGVYDLQSLADAGHAFDFLMHIPSTNLTPKRLLMAHQKLMKHQPLERQHKGHFRDIQVYVGGHILPAPPMVWPMIIDWMTNEWLNSDSITSHVAFERIHPFVDGNGRIGRMLMFMKQIKDEGGLHDVPTDADRQSYYAWFK